MRTCQSSRKSCSRTSSLRWHLHHCQVPEPRECARGCVRRCPELPRNCLSVADRTRRSRAPKRRKITPEEKAEKWLEYMARCQKEAEKLIPELLVRLFIRTLPGSLPSASRGFRCTVLLSASSTALVGLFHCRGASRPCSPQPPASSMCRCHFFVQQIRQPVATYYL